ncbi:intestinal mucin-like protein [Babylonia areolata]|uniref:intestinal mucin-like protein n=1 Tax=Babylonia areolata TaxID=304850 RepID=UPI003FD03625
MSTKAKHLTPLSLVKLVVTAAVLTIAVFTTTTASVSDDECIAGDGSVMKNISRGEFKTEGCRSCYCFEDGFAECTRPSCVKPSCWDAESPGAYCCDTCPNGRNCKTPKGTIVKESGSFIEDGKNCTCSDFTCGADCEGPAATCKPLPVVCRLENGTRMEGVEKPGDTWTSKDGCGRCTCEKTGRVTCTNITCTAEPSCPFALNVPGHCCKVCPADVDLCVLASKFYIKLKNTVELKNGTRCTCKKTRGSLDIDCFILSKSRLTSEQNKIHRARKCMESCSKRLEKLQDAVTKIDY